MYQLNCPICGSEDVIELLQSYFDVNQDRVRWRYECDECGTEFAKKFDLTFDKIEILSEGDE